MPAPAVVGVYVLAAVGSVAAGLAFKEFVYEPHIAPRVERWAEEFLAKRQARRARRAVAVPAECNYNLGDDAGTDAGTDADAGDGKSTYELESLVENEVRQWRAQVGEGSGLRHRKRVPAPGVGSLMAGSALDESNILIPYFPMSPTHVHVLFDPATDALSVADTDSHSVSGASSRVPTPAPSSSLLSRLTFRTPPPQPAVGRAPPTPEPSVRGRGSPAPSLPRTPVPTLNNTQAPDAFDASNTYAYTYAGAGGAAAFTSPHHVPSLSLSHPLDPDEQDVELLSAPSSSAPSERADPPFSELSRAHSQSSHSPFVLSPEFRTLSSVSSPVHSPFILSSELGTFSPDMGLRTLSSSSESGSELGEGDEAWSQSGSSWASAGRSS
ncbi:hypothetical protein B0H16DRAFT_1730104 [Mycena metata]|uniref:Uncharacterized protein n=1 Tax=Mycena metata TaxID=1033252 RepID=A0AAD7I992_9AGAR|nr:hypothetical protein B0H16DRAFT_1730104 [Mycena metata]